MTSSALIALPKRCDNGALIADGKHTGNVASFRPFYNFPVHLGVLSCFRRAAKSLLFHAPFTAVAGQLGAGRRPVVAIAVHVRRLSSSHEQTSARSLAAAAAGENALCTLLSFRGERPSSRPLLPSAAASKSGRLWEPCGKSCRFSGDRPPCNRRRCDFFNACLRNFLSLILERFRIVPWLSMSFFPICVRL